MKDATVRNKNKMAACYEKLMVLKCSDTGITVRILVEACVYVHVFPCYVFQYRYRPCGGPIPRPRSPTKCQKRFLLQKLILNQFRP